MGDAVTTVRPSPGNPGLARIVTHTPGFANVDELRDMLTATFRKQIEAAIDELDTAGNMDRASERMRKLRLVPDQCPPTRRSE